jgi:beta-phosphoglucomutase-like phosphatase (HAD superfamily)
MAGGIRAILFDFDGVLVDSEPVRFRAGREALADGGVLLTWELFARHWLGRPSAPPPGGSTASTGYRSTPPSR